MGRSSPTLAERASRVGRNASRRAGYFYSGPQRFSGGCQLQQSVVGCCPGSRDRQSQARRKLLFNELRADDELLSKNELTAGEIALARLRLAEGVYDTYQHWYEDNPEVAELRNEFAFMARVLSNLKRSTSDFVTANIYIQMSLVAQEKQSLDEMSLGEKKEYITTLIAAGQLDRLEGRLSRALTYIDKALRLISSRHQASIANSNRLRNRSKFKRNEPLFCWN